MSELRTQLESARAAHQHGAYPGDLAADVLAPEETERPLVLRLFYGLGVLATAAALTFAVTRFGAMTGTEPADWRRQLTAIGDRGKALVMTVSSGLPNDWELPSVRLPRMSRPSEFPQHLRMMSPINRVKQPDIELPEELLPGKHDARDATSEHAA
jgi:hypothetical protein